MKKTDNTPRPSSSPRRKDLRIVTLNILIVLLALVVGYLSYSFVDRNLMNPPVQSTKTGVATGDIIQLDVLNGCGISKAASSVTAFLRQRGYDVVEMRNYKTFDVQESIVIDRTGSLETARRVAYALGISEKNIIQQLNHDYYVDVSVVIGKDYQSLKASQ